MQETMTQEQFKKLLKEYKPKGKGSKPGDGSRYGKSHKRGVMNKTETEYSQILELQRVSGRIREWRFECDPIKLGYRCSYLPDFSVAYTDGSIRMVDVKGAGPINEASIVKIKWAASSHPEWTFVIARKTKAGWRERTIRSK